MLKNIKNTYKILFFPFLNRFLIEHALYFYYIFNRIKIDYNKAIY